MLRAIWVDDKRPPESSKVIARREAAGLREVLVHRLRPRIDQLREQFPEIQDVPIDVDLDNGVSGVHGYHAADWAVVAYDVLVTIVRSSAGDCYRACIEPRLSGRALIEAMKKL